MTDMPIYLDYHATTPVDPLVLETMLPFFTKIFGNPSSSMHSYGWDGNTAINTARKQVSNILGAKPKEITFTSGATEANNWVLQGILNQWAGPGKPHIITTNAEHKSILQPFSRAHKQGAELTILPVDQYGQISAEQIKNAIKSNTILISVIFANNEIGTINPIKEIGKVAKANDVFFHTDATQAIGKIFIDVNDLGIDFLSLSAHKIYGPKGSGALFIRSQSPKCFLEPLIIGGGQERDLRSGTVNVPGIVGLGKACEIAIEKMAEENSRLEGLRNLLVEKVRNSIPDIKVNGHPTKRLSHNANLSFSGVNPDEMLLHLSPIAVSTGSACSSASTAGSYVLKAIGLSDDSTRTTYRLGLGRWTTAAHIEKAAEVLINAYTKSRKTV